MEEKKIWAIKDGFLVNRDGSIYRLNWKRTGTMRKVKQSQRNDGYLVFWCNGKMTRVHRFVASCFIPNPKNLPCINHKDENKTNNRVENLEWCDCNYNNKYGTRNKRIAETKRTPEQSQGVFQYTLDGKFVKKWCSSREIERVLGFGHSHISQCCLGKLKSAYKYLWSYEPLDDLLLRKQP